MEPISRRSVLGVVQVGLGAAVAGCLADEPGQAPSDGGGSTPSVTPTPTMDGDIEYEVRSYGRSPGKKARQTHETWSGLIELYADEEAALADLDFQVLPEDRREDAKAFVEGTDFGDERLLYVASVGPSTCYDRVEIGSLSVDDDVLVGTANAIDTSEPDEGCGQAITYPSGLVRVRFRDHPRNEARLTVTDGWGGETEASANASSIAPGSLPGHVRPDGEPASVPDELVCDDEDFDRHGEGFSGDPPWGESNDHWGAFALRVDRLAVEQGDTVTVTLTNVGTKGGHTGNRHKYNLQVLTTAGWQDVRGATDGEPLGYTDEAVGHGPGEGFEWTIEMTQAGVNAGHAHEDLLSVCPCLRAGRYRFVFWEPAVAVAFDLEA
jgi:hypothetical protein